MIILILIGLAAAFAATVGIVMLYELGNDKLSDWIYPVYELIMGALESLIYR